MSSPEKENPTKNANVQLLLPYWTFWTVSSEMEWRQSPTITVPRCKARRASGDGTARSMVQSIGEDLESREAEKQHAA